MEPVLISVANIFLASHTTAHSHSEVILPWSHTFTSPKCKFTIHNNNSHWIFHLYANSRENSHTFSSKAETLFHCLHHSFQAITHWPCEPETRGKQVPKSQQCVYNIVALVLVRQLPISATVFNFVTKFDICKARH